MLLEKYCQRNPGESEKGFSDSSESFDFLLFLFVAVLSSVSPSTVLRTVVDSVAQGLAAKPVRMRASFVDRTL